MRMPGGNAGQCEMKIHDDIFYDAVFVHQERLRAERTHAHAHRVINQMMMPKLNLLVRTTPQRWESLESFAYRAVDLNGLRSLSEVARALRWKPGRPLPLQRCQQLMNSLGQGYTQLEPMIPTEISRKEIQLGGHTLKRGHLALSSGRFCPDCVKQYGYGRAYWSLAPLPVCEEHGTYLVDVCACNPDTPLNTARPGYTQCSCGADLRDSPRKRASLAAQGLAQEIVRRYKLLPDDYQDHPLAPVELPPETSLSDLLDLIAFLGSISPEYARMHLDRTRPVMRLSHVAKRFEFAAQALCCWPAGVFPLIRRAYSLLGEVPYSSRTAYRALQPVMNVAERWLAAHVYGWFAQAVAEFIKTPSAWSAHDNRFQAPDCARKK